MVRIEPALADGADAFVDEQRLVDARSPHITPQRIAATSYSPIGAVRVMHRAGELRVWIR
jgi:hypothetical protein